MNTHCAATVSLSNPTAQRSNHRHREWKRNAANSRHRQSAAENFVHAAAFDRFLCWLGPDPETAGQKYESIRGRLITMFRARRCVFAEELADATFERVMRKLNGLTTEFTGDPARYFYGVAKKIYLEYQREVTTVHRRSEFSLPTKTVDPDLEDLLEKLDEALAMLQGSDRDLILSYYAGSGKSKINHRRALAEQFGLGPNALRLRVFRIRREVKNYMSGSIGDALITAK